MTWFICSLHSICKSRVSRTKLTDHKYLDYSCVSVAQADQCIMILASRRFLHGTYTALYHKNKFIVFV